MKFSNFFNKQLTNYLQQQFNINEMLPIQELSIPAILKDQNTIVVSTTGSGKTFCYVLPLLTKLKKERNTQFLILAPTQELSKQIMHVIKSFNKFVGYEIAVYDAYDKHKKSNNISSQIVIGSPKRILELITIGSLNIANLKSVILDEADMLYEFFKLEITKLLNYFRQFKKIQYLMFSATLHESLANSIKNNIPNCKVIKDKDDIWNNANIKHHLVSIQNEANITSEIKLKVLLKLLENINPFFALIFANNKEDVLMIQKALLKQNYKVGVLYSGLNYKQRKDTILKAQKLQYNILVCTDLAARGIDLAGVSDVISFDLPIDDLYYIHRAGRTGRSKYSGNSYLFDEPKNSNKVLKLKNKLDLIKIKI